MTASTVFLGTPDFAVPVLRRIAASPHRPRLVVTPPDRPRGRGRRLAAPSVADAARELGIELLQSADVNADEARQRIASEAPDVAVVCAFGQLIREPLLTELEMLNVHPSLLPRWRGAAPIERAIMARDVETGVSIMQLTAGLDSGPVALQEAITIEPRDDYGSLAVRLADLAGPLMVRALDLRAAGKLESREQDDAGVTYAEKIEAADRHLDPSRPAPELEAVIRGLTPHIGAHLELAGGERLGVGGATVLDDELEPGRLLAAGAELRLGCAQGSLRLDQVKPAGGRMMPAGDYLRGHRPADRVL